MVHVALAKRCHFLLRIYYLGFISLWGFFFCCCCCCCRWFGFNAISILLHRWRWEEFLFFCVIWPQDWTLTGAACLFSAFQRRPVLTVVLTPGRLFNAFSYTGAIIGWWPTTRSSTKSTKCSARDGMMAANNAVPERTMDRCEPVSISTGHSTGNWCIGRWFGSAGGWSPTNWLFGSGLKVSSNGQLVFSLLVSSTGVQFAGLFHWSFNRQLVHWNVTVPVNTSTIHRLVVDLALLEAGHPPISCLGPGQRSVALVLQHATGALKRTRTMTVPVDLTVLDTDRDRTGSHWLAVWGRVRGHVAVMSTTGAGGKVGWGFFSVLNK